MKPAILKIFSVCAVIALTFICLSCKSTQPPSPQAQTQTTIPPAAPQTTPPPVTAAPPVTTTPPPVITIDVEERIFEEVTDYYQGDVILDGAQNYIIVTGDTLSEIARRYYGNQTNVYTAGTRNGYYFPIIMLASYHHNGVDIADPDLIHPGMELTIPDLRRNLDNTAARRALKGYLHDVAAIYRLKGHTETEEGLARLSDSIPQ